MCGRYAVKNKPPFQTKRNLPETAFKSDGPLVDDEGRK
jgi:hypothetical protein